jgi:hypothetical protein
VTEQFLSTLANCLGKPRYEPIRLEKERMSSRQNSDQTSASGVSYSAGTAANGVAVRNITESRSQDAATNSVLAKRWPNLLEVWADGSVFDTVTSTYLQPGKDFLIAELQRR